MTRRNLQAALYDPRHGGEAIRIERLKVGRTPFEPQRTNYFTVYWIESGSGTVAADAVQFAFGPRTLLFFVPYQHIRMVPTRAVSGSIIQFHANFLCVETFHAEAGCSGVLFNDPYGLPMVPLDEPVQAEVQRLITRLQTELDQRGLAFGEAMLAYLKVLLILATRLKSSDGATCGPAMDRHPILAPLRALIEEHYHTLHSPAEYAKRLHLTPKTLGRIVREQLGTTLTDLIRNRILIHAKWQLLHTLRPVKEIARELGFEDELYFSRLFKNATGHSPTFFREFETEIRGGSNLSMTSRRAPILAAATASDT